MKCVSEHQDLQFLCSNLTNISICQPLEIVGRGSETQLQVGENLNQLTSRIRVNNKSGNLY